MVYNSYFTNLIARLLLLLGTFIGLAYLLVNTSRFFTILFLALTALIQIISLVLFLNETNRNLARFLLLLTEEDTSVVAWKDRVERTFQGLHHSFKQVNEEIIRNRMEKEKGTVLLQNVIDHIQSGIFLMDDEGVIQLINKEALEIFGAGSIETLEEIDRIQPGLANDLIKLRYDSGNVLRIGNPDRELPVMVRVSVFRLGEKKLRLYSIQSIKNVLEANEIESWQKLTRVLAHEISNSITPISTLGAGIHRKLSQATLEKEGGMHIPENAARDLLQSAELIAQRGNALIEFVDHYKSFSRLPDPVMVPTDIRQLFENILKYFKDDLHHAGIALHIEVDDDMGRIHLDPNLLEQALINLVKNAFYALSDQANGMITLRGKQEDKSGVILEVTDNGPGISQEIRDQVFVPFFTTKQKGSGIGLSIVKKILNMHGGGISFRTGEDLGTSFTIRLPQNLPDQ